ncbi:MAG: hypothetical protein FWD83_00355 [Promicromonosporaceae bacterium]|nr:hypothetical protein [Promicromonosporaceae bacterium]
MAKKTPPLADRPDVLVYAGERINLHPETDLKTLRQDIEAALKTGGSLVTVKRTPDGTSRPFGQGMTPATDHQILISPHIPLRFEMPLDIGLHPWTA